MTFDEIARALRVNEKTIRRDWESIEQSFRDAGIDVANLGGIDAKVFLVVIVDHQNVQSSLGRDPENGRDPYAANSPPASPGRRAGSHLPRRWSKP